MRCLGSLWRGKRAASWRGGKSTFRTCLAEDQSRRYGVLSTKNPLMTEPTTPHLANQPIFAILQARARHLDSELRPQSLTRLLTTIQEIFFRCAFGDDAEARAAATVTDQSLRLDPGELCGDLRRLQLQVPVWDLK